MLHFGKIWQKKYKLTKSSNRCLQIVTLIHLHINMTPVQKLNLLRTYNFNDFFYSRLCFENSWSAEFTKRVVDEYFKFMVLTQYAEKEVTPSDEVDQVWHLHILHSQEYFEIFCPNFVGRAVHHGPTKGGTEQNQKFLEQYNQTLKKYSEIFGGTPPKDIWPPAEDRFGITFQRVNMKHFQIIPRISLLKPFVAALFFLTGCVEKAKPENATSDTWVIFALCFVFFLFCWFLITLARVSSRRSRRNYNYSRGVRSSSSDDDASFWTIFCSLPDFGGSDSGSSGSGCGSSGCGSSGCGGGGCGGGGCGG